MPYQLDPGRPLPESLVAVATERLDDALARLDRLAAGGAAAGGDVDPTVEVHEVRKRSKEVRGLARLVRPALGRDAYRAVKDQVRDAAGELSSLRDDHALLGAIDGLVEATGEAELLAPTRARQAARAEEATRSLGADDPRLAVARARLHLARTLVGTWDLPDEAATVGDGLARTYRRGRKALRAVLDDEGDDELVHDWRKRVKDLWYQARLLEPGDPDVVGPLVTQLDELSDLLGDDHDLAVLAERLEPDAGAVLEVVRARQAVLRAQALQLGRQLYEPEPSQLARRLAGPWAASLRG